MRNDLRRGFTLFQLLVVLAILVILFALFLPALVKARMVQARAHATNNVKHLCLGVINYAGTNKGHMPLGADDKHFSTATYILPYIEQDNLFKQIDLKKPIDDPANAAARKVRVKTFLSSADPIEGVKPEWGATNYLYNDQVLCDADARASYPASIQDGTSNTIMVGETLKGDGMTKATDVKRQYVLLKKEDLKSAGPNSGVKYFKDNKDIAGDRCASWMDGRFLQGTFNGKLQPNDERPDVSCGGVSGVSALRSFDDFVIVGLADGSGRAVKNAISRTTWQAALTPAGGEVLGSDW